MLSTFTWISLIIVLVIIKYIYVLPRDDKQLFELYGVRDEIAMEAMYGKISQESEEYKFVISNINFWIYNTHNDYDFSIALYNWINLADIKQNVLDKLLKNIERYPVLTKGLKK